MTTDKLMLGLIMLQIGTHIVAIINSVYSPTRCISYKKVLPNGICIDELKKYRVAQTSIKARSVNNRGKWVKAFLSFVENKPFTKVQLYGKRLFQEYFTRNRFLNCTDNPKLKRFLQHVKTNLFKKISIRCVSSIRRLLCHLLHPVCFKSEDGNIILSPPCRRLCTESDCENFGKTWLYNITLQLHKLCPNRIRDPSKEQHLYSCTQFPMADIKNIEKCQNKVETKNKHFSELCYDGKNTSYNGTVNITSTGKACLPWNINPFLSSPVYSNLKNNYCRNPQGYATSPWCYVNATNRDWEFCDVPKCGGNNKANNKNVNSISIAIKVVIIVSVLVFTFVLVRSSWKIYRFWRKIKDETPKLTTRCSWLFAVNARNGITESVCPFL
ncbi:muscle, skeletal receptor tyrosine protein kinase-like isoform X2 [Hydractinia symbiolongicarpus]|uniref:muscle, skeletal receptor tyrosine protein kinase-like isoform X2 n=1 Tax=Hydractinia symbiolongicarpus TaxID=13093 RepID=UPI0025504DED|nr:muscle, skeletal receptor tyrosine protein kinase-like isoform X2 [Hydractinia symbiolongicarpus]